MDIIVCVKRVPLTQEIDLQIDSQKRDIKKDMLAYSINEWDNYAIEEAIQLREKAGGGSVTAVTVGKEEDEEILRRCLAMGADKAIRIDPGDIDADTFVISTILSKVIQGMDHDLVLTGVQADDDNCGSLGGMLAEQLGLARASVVNGIHLEESGATVNIELEGGMEEIVRISLPALFTIQTGINEPRYVSIMGIRKAAKKELNVMDLKDLGLSADDLVPGTFIEELFLPPETEGAKIIEGDPNAVAQEILHIIKEKGVNF